ncbi:MAG: hypothetical protein OSJ62_12950 [Lachnospiraceae bacterium]|nr:hypothetical protein [Lachnospiraceae bacterium]
MTDSKSKVICKNNFKGEKDTTTKENFTKKWINIVNQLERNKNVH